jgi:hypothetical protein
MLKGNGLHQSVRGEVANFWNLQKHALLKKLALLSITLDDHKYGCYERT